METYLNGKESIYYLCWFFKKHKLMILQHYTYHQYTYYILFHQTTIIDDLWWLVIKGQGVVLGEQTFNSFSLGFKNIFHLAAELKFNTQLWYF